MAVWARKNTAEPTWYTYMAVVCGIFGFAGYALGMYVFNTYTQPYYALMDLKVAKGIDATATDGKNVMDTGIFYFNQGNALDETRSWHFKHGTLYCVAPIITNNTVPYSQSFDFWAIGKDCCSLSSSDFRCSNWGSSSTHTGVRLFEDSDLVFFKLAVQQAESVFSIRARNPVFLRWSNDPMVEMSNWQNKAYTTVLEGDLFAFIASVFCLSLAACSFAWIGRTDSAYGTAFYDDPYWASGGAANQPINYETRTYHAA